MARFSVLMDACVLVPVVLTDTMLRLAEAGLYRPLWSDRLRGEAQTAIARVHPDMPEMGKRRFAVMDAHFPDASVMGWESLVPAIELPDPQDRHVVAAAVVGRADLIVTSNLKDFPVDVLAAFDLEVRSPDDFLLDQLDLEPRTVIEALYAQAAASRRPEQTFDEVLKRLAGCGAPQFARAAAAQAWRVGG